MQVLAEQYCTPCYPELSVRIHVDLQSLMFGLPQASNRVATGIAEAHDVLYRVVSDQANGFSAAGVSVRHSPAQIRTILGVA